MDNIWQLLLPALIGIIPGTIALIIQYRSKKAEAIRLSAAAEKAKAERKDIEDQITERVLKRAKEEINGLTLENEKVNEELETVKKDRVKLTKRVKELEAKHEKLERIVESLKEGIQLLCRQLSDAGVEPVFVLGDTDGED